MMVKVIFSQTKFVKIMYSGENRERQWFFDERSDKSITPTNWRMNRIECL